MANIRIKRVIFLIMGFIPIAFSCFSQSSSSFHFRLDTTVTVSINDQQVINPWAGGINAAQISTMDLNGDSKEDLVVFDRTTNQIIPLLVIEKNGNFIYQHSPSYEFLFPSVTNWALWVDYNKDGKKDLFTTSSQGVQIYKNITSAGNPIQFQLIKDPLLIKGFSGMINLSISSTDIPAIVDVDDDGDVDILAFNFSSGSYIEWYKNVSIEKYNHAEELEFERTGFCWGNFTKEHGCDEYEFGNIDCQDNEEMSGGKIMHTGSTLFAQDIDNDGDKDLLIGSIHCGTLTYLQNKGTKSIPVFDSIEPFPSNSTIDLNSFAAAFYEDIDHDGKKDIIASPNLSMNDGDAVDFSHSIWLYKNKSNSFEFIQTNFLQDQMIDVGEYAYPSLVDYDYDGDLDLFVGSRGILHANSAFYATVYFFENIGTAQQAQFKLITTDFAELSQWKATSIKSQFLDMNEDGRMDLILTFSKENKTSSHVFFNSSIDGKIKIDLTNSIELLLPLNEFDSPWLVDVDQDGNLDVLIGKSSGALQYYQNKGSNTNPNFILENNSYFNLTDGFFTRNRFVTTNDLDGNGKLELITTDQTGTVQVYSDFQQTINSPITSIFYNPWKNAYEPETMQKELFPAIGDLTNDRVPEMIIGTNGGGLRYFLNETFPASLSINDCQLSFSIFPNPARAEINIYASCAGEISMYDTWGRKIENWSIPSNGLFRNISTEFLRSGVYIIRFQSSNGILTRRLSIVH